MFSQTSAPEPISPAASTPARLASGQLEPLDSERFEDLNEAEAEALLASRFCSFVERGWGWKEALLLAVRPDAPALTRPGDASSR